jgi:hypothetical protein
MLSEYRRHRHQGQPHHGALKALSRRFGLDPDTVGRIIARTERAEQALGGKVENLEQPPATPRLSAARPERNFFRETPSPGPAGRERCP